MRKVAAKELHCAFVEFSSHHDTDGILNYCFASTLANQWISDEISIPVGILESVVNYFDVKLEAVAIVGSAKFGFSPISMRKFRPGFSDLDIAIVDQPAFLRYRDLLNPTAEQNPDSFSGNVIRPDHHPEIHAFSDWKDYLKTLSNGFLDRYSDITVAIYEDVEKFRQAQVSTMLVMMALFNISRRQKTLSQECELDNDAAATNFLKEIGALSNDVCSSFPYNSSPWCISLPQLEEKMGYGARGRLLNAFRIAVEEMPNGLNPFAALIGGSFTNSEVITPKDLDCAFYYALDSTAPYNAAVLHRAAKHILRFVGIDCRLVPVDLGPLLLIKLTSYMTNLYAANKSGGACRRTLLLVEF